MPDPIVVSYAVTAAEFLFIAGLLAVGAWRNHFTYHRVRPIIIALAFLCAVTGLQAAMRVLTAYLRTTGDMAAYITILESPWWLWINVLAAIGGLVLVFTLLLAYPGSRRKS